MTIPARIYAAGTAFLIVISTATPAAPVSYLGAVPLVRSSGSVVARFEGDPSALYDNELYLDTPAPIGPVFNNHVTPVGATQSLGVFFADDELGIRNRSFSAANPSGYDFNFYTGIGTANPDGLPHARFTFDPDVVNGDVTIAFEDQVGGGDLDFDDGVYTFSNVRIGLVENTIGADNPVGNTVTIDPGEIRALAVPIGLYANQGVIINTGTLFHYGSFSNSGSLFSDDTFFSDLTSDIDNEVGALLENTASMSLAGALNNLGTVANFGALSLLGNFNNEGALTNDQFGSINVVGTGAEFNNSGTFSNNGTTEIAGDVINSGIIQNAGEVISQGSGQITQEIGGAIENLGTWTSAAGSSLDTAGSIQNAGSLTMQAGSNINQQVGGAIENLGDWAIGAGASVSGSGTYTQSSGSTVVNGTLSGAVIDVQGGIVSGVGKIEGFFNVGADGTVAPGNSPGTLQVDGDFALDGGTLKIELAALDLHDVLDITGEAVFTGGTIDYDFGFTPLAGDSFVFLTAGGGILGAGTLSFNVLGEVGGPTFMTEVIGNSLVLTAVPLPGGLWLLAPGVVALAARVKRRP